LVRLNLFYNRLAGKIVKFVGELSSLDVLQLCENNFTGGILAKLNEVVTKRKIIDVSMNKLTGVLPDDLACRCIRSSRWAARCSMPSPTGLQGN
jgi:hypothetical protein